MENKKRTQNLWKKNIENKLNSILEKLNMLDELSEKINELEIKLDEVAESLVYMPEEDDDEEDDEDDEDDLVDDEDADEDEEYDEETREKILAYVNKQVNNERSKRETIVENKKCKVSTPPNLFESLCENDECNDNGNAPQNNGKSFDMINILENLKQACDKTLNDPYNDSGDVNSNKMSSVLSNMFKKLDLKDDTQNMSKFSAVLMKNMCDSLNINDTDINEELMNNLTDEMLSVVKRHEESTKDEGVSENEEADDNQSKNSKDEETSEETLDLLNKTLNNDILKACDIPLNDEQKKLACDTLTLFCGNDKNVANTLLTNFNTGLDTIASINKSKQEKDDGDELLKKFENKIKDNVNSNISISNHIAIDSGSSDSDCDNKYEKEVLIDEVEESEEYYSDDKEIKNNNSDDNIDFGNENVTFSYKHSCLRPKPKASWHNN